MGDTRHGNMPPGYHGQMQVIDRQVEMAAFDALPAELRQALNDGEMKWTAWQAAQLLQSGFSVALLIQILRANDQRARQANPQCQGPRHA